jgi:flavin reductase (DIM6/NTAB) family NADH-FMN oxidoreductase RutF
LLDRFGRVASISKNDKKEGRPVSDTINLDDRVDADGGLDIDPKSLSVRDRYKLLCGLVIPRPIALVTTLSQDGVVNAAPFSFFNLFSDDPPIAILGVNLRGDGAAKDTAKHVKARGEYVIHIVSEEFGNSMNACAIDFPEEISEIDEAGFTLKPSRRVAPPTIVEAAVALECRLHSIIPFSERRAIIVGEVVQIKARPGIVDPAKLYVDLKKYRPMARLFGNLYATLGEVYELKRETYEEWSKRTGRKK